jgi:TatD DNase family protein
MNKSFFDTHAHITSQELYPDIDGIISRAKNNQVNYIVNVASDLSSLEKGLLLRKKYPFVYLAAAIHPHDTEKNNEEFQKKIQLCLQDKKLVAIGEIGLDYFYKHSTPEIQKKSLIQDLMIASEMNLPVIIHCREAFNDLFPIMDKHYPKKEVVLHCFTGTILEAREAIKRGWKISVSGIITFTKSLALQETVKEIPIENLFIETDSPYLAPLTYRGKTNEPSYIIETAKKLAMIQSLTLDEVAAKTTENALNFFKIKN